MDQALIIGLLAATLRIATPILLAGLGEVFAERAGVLNLGIEGIMLMGVLLGFIAAYLSGQSASSVDTTPPQTPRSSASTAR